MPRPADPARFAIAGHLLAGEQGDWRWNNLGYWQPGQDYSGACCALADRHAQAVGLAARSAPRLLELGCGFGAGLSLWRQRYGVQALSALEFRPDCIAHLQQQTEIPLQQLVQGRFDGVLPAPLTPAGYDVVLCVDAAYHARSLPAFLALLSSALAPAGGLAFTTLLWPPRRLPAWQRRGVLALLAQAQIPAASLCDEATLTGALSRAGLVDVRLEYLDSAVLQGFHTWVMARHSQLSLRQRYSPGWLKIRATARLCDYLHRHQLLRYALVSASKGAEQTKTVTRSVE